MRGGPRLPLDPIPCFEASGESSVARSPAHRRSHSRESLVQVTLEQHASLRFDYWRLRSEGRRQAGLPGAGPATGHSAPTRRVGVNPRRWARGSAGIDRLILTLLESPRTPRAACSRARSVDAWDCTLLPEVEEKIDHVRERVAVVGKDLLVLQGLEEARLRCRTDCPTNTWSPGCRELRGASGGLETRTGTRDRSDEPSQIGAAGAPGPRRALRGKGAYPADS